MDSLTSLHDFLTNATSILNFVVSVELTIACTFGRGAAGLLAGVKQPSAK
jgi:hypothetical protein